MCPFTVRAPSLHSLEAFLGSLGSITLWGLRPSYSPLEVLRGRISLPSPSTGLNLVFHHQADLPFFVTPSLQPGGTGILTRFPSATPFSLTLGPDLPWEDEPSPGTLGLTARWILTTFIATHASILTSHRSRPPFGNPSPLMGTLPYRYTHHASRSFGTGLKPRFIFGANSHRPVSCYALFKGWLLLSLPPGCLGKLTSFAT